MRESEKVHKYCEFCVWREGLICSIYLNPREKWKGDKECLSYSEDINIKINIQMSVKAYAAKRLTTANVEEDTVAQSNNNNSQDIINELLLTAI